MKFIGKAVFYILLLVALLTTITLMVRYLHKPFGRAPQSEHVENSPHYADGKFQNPVETPMLKFSEGLPVLKRYINRNVEKEPASNYRFKEQRLADTDNARVQLNWLGHATVLIRQEDTYLLTDPVLVGRASPFSFTGPDRFFPSPIDPQALPDIDAVIISHDHYDHLSYETLQLIQHKVKRFYVPLGVAASLKYWGVPEEKIQEVSWWQEYRGENFSLTAAPARHFSGRFLTQNNTFWASYAIRIGDQNIYFGGDSGYFEGYEEIGKRLGPFDLSLMPIGAYDTAWANIHLNPEEAVQAQLEVQGGRLLPIHWGTFDLALHSWYEPMEWLINEAEKKDISLLTPQPGQWVNTQSETDAHWWKAYRKR